MLNINLFVGQTAKVRILSMLHKTCFSLLLASWFGVAPAQAQPPQGFEGGPGRMMRSLPIMVALDADGNGELSSDEIAQATAALKKLDKDNDGKVSSAELRPESGQFGFGPPDGRGTGGGRRPEGASGTGPAENEKSADRPNQPSDRSGAAADRPSREFPGGPPGFGGFGGFGGPGGSPEAFIDRLFQFDEDKDGKLTREELGKMFQRTGPGRGPGEPGIGRGGEATRPRRPQ